ncbi:MAG: amidohydrolase [Bacteroidetes bacterium SB0662_bin_6]|nr:amidohydrolase [Bacteroidetes bacterium SB0668_bin_1]MYE04975.1 amidohydrolase [Bacteroidetes bacterium SB0662_bin_6]
MVFSQTERDGLKKMSVIADIPSMDVSNLAETGREQVEFATFLRDIRRDIHQHPELGFEEYRTSEFVRSILEQHGLAVTGPLAGTGLYTDIEGIHDGPVIAYRADMDALPTADAKSVEYASRQPGVAHLCGHDAHTAIAIGVALILHRNREHLRGTVRVLFQPDEEGTPGGGVNMIREGVLDGVQSIYAIHVDPSLEAGRYGVLDGPITSSKDRFRICVKASSTGHSARPHEVVDTVWVANQIANALYQMVGRFTDARQAAVLTICRFHAGDAYNVIPEQAELGGTIRTTDAKERTAINQRLERIANELAGLYGVEVQVDIEAGAPAVKNDPRLTKHVASVIRSFCGEEAVFHIPLPSMGSEDFGHYLEKIPGMLLRAGTRSGPESAYPLHSDHFDIDEGAMAPTAALMAHVLRTHLDQEPG